METIYWKDLDISLNGNNIGDLKDDTELNALSNSIQNILSTLAGQRRMLPTFAVGLYNYLFEPIDEITAFEIGEQLLEAIQEWDDRVIVENIHVIPKYDQNQYNISVTFRAKDLNETKTIDKILYTI